MDHIKLIIAQQPKTIYSYKYTKDKLHRTNAITWFYKKRCSLCE